METRYKNTKYQYGKKKYNISSDNSMFITYYNSPYYKIPKNVV